MINCLRTALCISQCLLFTSRFYAQPGVALPVLNNVAVGASITPSVSVTGFSNVASAQFVVVWNQQVLQFQGVEGFNLPEMTENSFGMAETAQGLLRFGWAGGGNGVSVSNGTSIFTIHFQVIGADQSGSALTITEVSPTAFEIVRNENDQFLTYTLDDVQITSGFVAVGYTVAADEPGVAALPLLLAPNPFHESVAATFTLDADADVQITITDAAGRSVFSEQRHIDTAGTQVFHLSASQLPAAGTYFFTVRTPVQSCTQPLLFL